MTSLYQKPETENQRSSIMTARRTLGGLSLLSGLGLGAALMYLLDPEKGPTRRARLRDTAADTLSTTGQVLGNTVSSLSSTAANLGSSLGSGAASLGSRAADLASDYLQRGKDALPSSVSDYLPEMEDEDEGFSTTTFILTAAGCAAAGAALMFLLDPNQGRHRRALIADKTTSTLRRSTQTLSKKARHAGNVAKGMYHQAASRFSSEESESQPAPSSFNPDM
jgi:gas vesicle protein